MGLSIPDSSLPTNNPPKPSPLPESTLEEEEVLSFSLYDFAAQNVRKIAILGNANTGKTHTGAVELMDMLLEEGVDPNDINIQYIDVDGGISKVITQLTFPKEYLKRITYMPCKRFYQVEQATKKAFTALDSFSEDHPLTGCWIVVDNTKRCWRWIQDEYCRAVYQMSLTEKMEEARRSQIEAKKRAPDAKGDGVFNRNLDYAVMTPIHNDWFTQFATTPYNVLLLSPWTQDEIKDKHNSSKIIGYQDRWGQTDNELVPDYIIKKYFGTNRERLADFTKSRSTDALPTQVKNPTLSNLFKSLQRLEEIEAKDREKVMSKRTFPSLLSPNQGGVLKVGEK